MAEQVAQSKKEVGLSGRLQLAVFMLFLAVGTVSVYLAGMQRRLVLMFGVKPCQMTKLKTALQKKHEGGQKTDGTDEAFE